MEINKNLPPVAQSILKDVDFEDDKLISLADQLIKDPENGTLYYDLGHILHTRGKKVAAMDAYTESLRLKKGYYLAHFGLAVLFSSVGKLKHAMREYARAIKLKPDFVEGIYNLASCYESVRDWSHAAQLWQQYIALEKNPTWISEAKQNLEKCRAMAGQGK